MAPILLLPQPWASACPHPEAREPNQSDLVELLKAFEHFRSTELARAYFGREQPFEGPSPDFSPPVGRLSNLRVLGEPRTPAQGQAAPGGSIGDPRSSLDQEPGAAPFPATADGWASSLNATRLSLECQELGMAHEVELRLGDFEGALDPLGSAGARPFPLARLYRYRVRLAGAEGAVVGVWLGALSPESEAPGAQRLCETGFCVGVGRLSADPTNPGVCFEFEVPRGLTLGSKLALLVWQQEACTAAENRPVRVSQALALEIVEAWHWQLVGSCAAAGQDESDHPLVPIESGRSDQGPWILERRLAGLSPKVPLSAWVELRLEVLQSWAPNSTYGAPQQAPLSLDPGGRLDPGAPVGLVRAAASRQSPSGWFGESVDENASLGVEPQVLAPGRDFWPPRDPGSPGSQRLSTEGWPQTSAVGIRSDSKAVTFEGRFETQASDTGHLWARLDLGGCRNFTRGELIVLIGAGLRSD